MQQGDKHVHTLQFLLMTTIDVDVHRTDGSSTENDRLKVKKIYRPGCTISRPLITTSCCCTEEFYLLNSIGLANTIIIICPRGTIELIMTFRFANSHDNC